MGDRRRPAAFGGQTMPSSHISGTMPGAIGGAVGRPGSAPRRKATTTSGFTGVWSKDHNNARDWRPYAPAERGSPFAGLTRQASAPSLAAQGSNPNVSYEASMLSAPGGTSYDRTLQRSSPAMRRSASASSIGLRGAPPRPGSAGVPRRRPFEAPSVGNTANQRPRADALQLESRLTERLREHSLSTGDVSAAASGVGASAAAGGTRHGGAAQALPRWRPTPGHWQPDSRFSTPASYLDTTSAGSPGLDATLQHAQRRRAHQPRGGSFGRPPVAPHHESFLGPSFDGSGLGHPDAGYEDTLMPEARLKIYSDLFEEVIERDRVFGSLLRKIKTAYDTMLLRGPDMVPPMPDMDGQRGLDPSAVARAAYGGVRSTEPTSRPEDASQAWEVHRENNMLKDLVERLHLELEEAVRRETRWRNKASKLKARADNSASQQSLAAARALEGHPQHAGGQQQGRPRAHSNQAHYVPSTVAMAPDMVQLPPGHGGGYMHSDAYEEAHHWQHRSHKDGGANAAHHAGLAAHEAASAAAAAAAHGHGVGPGFDGGSCAGAPDMVGNYHSCAHGSNGAAQKVQPAGNVHGHGHGHAHQASVPGGSSACAGHGMQHPVPHVYDASRREPTAADFEPAADVTLNQGGLLSLSTISPQTSPPPPPPQQPASPGALDTGRSTDSGMLPQRPDRRVVIRPSKVPPLDFARLKQLEEEEDEVDEQQYAQQGYDREPMDDVDFHDQQDILEYIQALQQHLTDCEREGLYEEAEFARARLEQLREHEELQAHLGSHAHHGDGSHRGTRSPKSGGPADDRKNAPDLGN